MLDTGHLAILPEGVEPSVIGPILCAGVTAYRAVRNADIQKGQYMVVLGAGGGLGHLAVQYGLLELMLAMPREPWLRSMELRWPTAHCQHPAAMRANLTYRSTWNF